jgi:uncharacterized membrane protein
MDLKSRLRNKAFIFSVIGFVMLLIKTFTNYQLPEDIDILVNTGLSILVGAGILNDPTTENSGFGDDK